jgi:large subunit ribosomal protein L29
MKQVDVKELRQLSIAELGAKSQEYKNELFESRFALRTGHLQDASKVRKARRAFAQVQTLISERRNTSAAGAA